MPRSLSFNWQGNDFACEIHKVDRGKLYGNVSIETLDMDGEKSELATLLDDGKTLIPNGGTATGYMNPSGEWVDRDELTPVDYDGNELETVPSSFDAPIDLEAEASIEEFLDHSVRLTYALKSDAGITPEFMTRLQDGAIFKTHFSYRGGIDPDPAFIMQGEDETVWLLIGERSRVAYTQLEQAAVVEPTQDEEDETDEDSDELDFSML